MQEELAKAQDEAANEVVEASAGGGMVTVKANGAGEVVEIAIDPRAIDPDDPELLADMVLAAVERGAPLRARADGVEDVGPDARRPRRARRALPGSVSREHTSEADGYAAAVLSPAVENLVTQLTKLPGNRPAHGPAARVPPPLRPARGRARALACDRGREGARPLLPRVREPHGGRALRGLLRRAGATGR